MAAIKQGKMRASNAQLMGVALLFFFLILSPTSMAQVEVCDNVPGKKSWPELVGLPGQIAPPIIKFQNRYVKEVPVLLDGAGVTKDFRCDRVRVWIKPNGIIYQTPTLG